MYRLVPPFFAVLLATVAVSAAEPNVPQSVEQLFADFDPRQAPLEAQTVREWEFKGLVLRYVTFHVGTFRGRASRVAAFYGFPKGAQKLPGLLHLHGGGQRAFLHEVEFYAQRGYACLSLNWGGRPMEGALDDDPNTDWGAVDPTQNNVPGYFNLLPGDKYLDDFESPRNNNWYLLTLAAQRGLTFLEQQPEVDPDTLGVYGHSMGGNLTVYLAGSDKRVKAAAPSVGGSGFRSQPWPLLPEYRPQLPRGDVRLFDATLGFESYSPRITAPLLWLGSTNDFHGLMDDTYRTGELIPHANVRYVFTPHMNHRFTPEFAVARPLWFDQHLKGAAPLPKTPESKLILTTDDHVPSFEVMADDSREVADVHIYYSVDPDPRARFWRSAIAMSTGPHAWSAKLPLSSVEQPLFAFANVVYRSDSNDSEPHARRTDRLAISSLLNTATPQHLTDNKVVATDRRESVIDDFRHGWRDWYALSPDNPHHWEYSTRKLNDPKWRGNSDQRLSVEVQAIQSNELVIVLTENFFRSYRGRQQEYVAVRRLKGGAESETITFQPNDFRAADGSALASWQSVDLLSLRAYYEKNDTLVGSKTWSGPQPVFSKLEWVTGHE